MELKLTPRLQCAADLVEPCSSVIDVGTDHAYLPLYLIMNGKCESAVASDINQAPLTRARTSIRKYLGKKDDRIKTVLSDGLAGIDETFDYIIIAGLGGETIENIIREGGITDGQRLILQPMTKARELRRFLYENGFSIENEIAVAEGAHRVYTVMSVVAGISCEHTVVDEFLSPQLQSRTDDVTMLYKKKVLQKQKKRVDGLFSTTKRREGELEREQEIYKALLLHVKPELL